MFMVLQPAKTAQHFARTTSASLESETEMFRMLTDWIEKRRQIRRGWQRDAQMMVVRHGRHAYYEAQRLAARSRAIRDRSGFWHWAKVASEVARFSPDAEMDIKTVQEIADEEMRKHRQP